MIENILVVHDSELLDHFVKHSVTSQVPISNASEHFKYIILIQPMHALPPSPLSL